MRSPSPTRIPAVVDAIVTLAGTIADVTVLDGPIATAPLEDVVAVGVGDESVVVQYVPQSGYGQGLTERLDVVCTIVSWSGEPDAMHDLRIRAAEILTAIDEGLRADNTLGGVCQESRLGFDASWRFENGEGGAAVWIGFTVHTETLI